MPNGNTILSVAKAMQLLQLLSVSGRPLSLKEIAEQAELPKSTAFGLLTTMREYDVISQETDGKYGLGLRLFEYGCQIGRSWDISAAAKPYMARADAEKLLRRQKMTQFTPHTITELPELMQEIERCRENGYAIENGEYKIGLRSISAPVRTVDGEVRYTVGVIGMFRSTHSEEFAQAVEKVRATAGMISAALGYRK